MFWVTVVGDKRPFQYELKSRLANWDVHYPTTAGIGYYPCNTCVTVRNKDGFERQVCLFLLRLRTSARHSKNDCSLREPERRCRKKCK
jgi:hypothetical protein